MVLQEAFPARGDPFLSPILLTLIGVLPGKTIVALYARVSTKDKGHSTENQPPELLRFAQVYGYTVYKEYVEQESGGTGKRLEFQTLLIDSD